MQLLLAKTALIDFDILPYLYGFVHEHKRYKILSPAQTFGEEVVHEVLDSDLTKRQADSSLGDHPVGSTVAEYLTPSPLAVCLGDVAKGIKKILSNTKVSDYQGFMTGPGNFRLYTATIQPYKGNRVAPKPLLYHQIKQYLLENYKVQVAVGNEADDELSIAQDPNGTTIICSIDKDLRINPGRHYNISTQELSEIDTFGYLEIKLGGGTSVTKKIVGGGLKFFWAQCLMGDPTDNIPKVAGYGPVKVMTTLEGATSHIACYEIVKKIYDDKFGEVEGPRRLLEVGRLLWMQQEPHEVWVPPCLPIKTEKVSPNV